MHRRLLLAAACCAVARAAPESVSLAPERTLASADDWTFEGKGWHLADSLLTQSSPKGLSRAFFRPAVLGDTSLQVDFRAHDDGTGVKAAGLILRSVDSLSSYSVHYDTKNDQIILSRGGVSGERREITRRRRVRMETGRWYTARTDLVGSGITVYLDGKPLITAGDDDLAAGLVGLYTSQGKVDFRELKVTGTKAALKRQWRTRMSYEVPADQGVAEVIKTDVICKQPGRYIGWPTVCRKRDGELLAVFSGDRDQHVCPWGKVQLVRSSDDGKTWSEPATICNTPLDDRDAGIIETRHGTLVVAWFTSLAFENSLKGDWLRGLEPPEVLNQWRLHAGKLTANTRERWLGYWTRRSEDRGRTWDAPVRTKGSAPHGGIELADGRLLFVGRCRPHRDSELTVEESRDDGKSWQQIASIGVDPEDNVSEFHEPHVVETADGRLVAMFRYHYVDKTTKKRDGTKCFLRQADSTDGGRTWTPARATGLLGYPPHLIKLRDGTLVCVYGRRVQHYGEYACLSRDGGRTWDVGNEIKLAGAMNGDLGYPASTELGDGSILTVYYQIHQSGEKTCLMGTHWRVKDASP